MKRLWNLLFGDYRTCPADFGYVPYQFCIRREWHYGRHQGKDGGEWKYMHSEPRVTPENQDLYDEYLKATREGSTSMEWPSFVYTQYAFENKAYFND